MKGRIGRDLAIRVVLLLSLSIPEAAAATCVVDPQAVRGALDAASVSQQQAPVGNGEWHGNIFLLAYGLGGSYDAEVAGQPNLAPRQWVARSFFSSNPDHYDFLVVFTNFEWSTAGHSGGRYWPIANDTAGIGIDSFDFAPEFGSERLQGFVDGMLLQGYLLQDGALDERRITQDLSHQLAHRWLASCSFVDNGVIKGDLLGIDQVHWSYLLDSDASFLYGSDWADNGDGTFTATQIRAGFSQLDLYLMGLIPPEEVSPLTLLENPAVAAAQVPVLGDTIMATARTVAIDQIIAAEGPRLPSHEDSQHELSLAIIYLVDPQTTVTTDELELLEELRTVWQGSFFRHTEGRGVLDVAPRGDLPVGNGSVDLQAAIDWLVVQTGSWGMWQDSPATAVRDTAVAVNALARAGGHERVVEPALTGLFKTDIGAGELRARQLETLALQGASGIEVLADELVASESPEGGWAAFPRYSSDVVTTARAVRALVAANRLPAAERGWTWLVGQQGGDGGWGWQPGQPSSVGASLEVLLAARALMADFWTHPAVSAGVTWLLDEGRIGGGFGDSHASIAQTARLLQLALDRPIDQTILQQAIDYLAGNQAANGSWESSTFKTAIVIDALIGFALPDPWVGPTELFLDPASPFDDEPTQLIIAVRNDGVELAAGARYEWVVHRADDPGTPVSLIQGTLPTIPETGFVSITDTLSPGLGEGFYEVRFAIDPYRQISEKRRDNNSTTAVLAVRSHPEGVELELSDSAISANPDHITAMPQPISVAGRVTNNGLSQASGVVIGVFDGDPADGLLLGSTVVTVPALGAATFTVPVTLQEARRHTLTVVVDPNNLAGDNDRHNNRVAVQLGLTQVIDLEIDPAGLTAVPPGVPVGEPLGLVASVHNGGTTEVSDFQVAFSYETGSPPIPHLIEQQTIAGPIPPNGAVTVQTVWSPNVAGDPLIVTVEVDPQGSLGDSQPANNRANLQVTITPSALPNLRVAAESLVFDPGPPRQGQVCQVSASISNPTANDAGPFSVELWLDEIVTGTLLAQTSFAGLAAGAATTMSAGWDVVDPADRLVHVIVDPSNELAEFNEGDNQAFVPADVQTLPDLALTRGSIDIDPDYPHLGDTVHLEVRVANQGDQPAPVSLLELRDEAGELIDSTAIPPLDGHAEVTLGLDWPTGTFAGDKLLRVRANPELVFAELEQSNNTVSLNLGVQNAELFVSNQIFSPNGDGVKDTTTIFFRADLSAVQIRDDEGSLVSAIDVPPDAGSVTWDGVTGRGHLARDGLYEVNAGDLSTWVEVDNNLMAISDDIEQLLLVGFLEPLIPGGDDERSWFTSMIMNPLFEELYLVERYHAPGTSDDDDELTLKRFNGHELVGMGPFPADNNLISSDAQGSLFTIGYLGGGPFFLLSYPGPVSEAIMSPGGWDHDPWLSPDGRWILWISSGQESVILEDRTNPGTTYPFDPGSLAGEGACGYSVEWSGRSVAAVTIRTCSGGAYFYEIVTSDPPQAHVEAAADWSSINKSLDSADKLLAGSLDGPESAVDFERRLLTLLAVASDGATTAEVSLFDLDDGSFTGSGLFEPDVSEQSELITSLCGDGSVFAYSVEEGGGPVYKGGVLALGASDGIVFVDPDLQGDNAKVRGSDDVAQYIADWATNRQRSLPFRLDDALWSPTDKYLVAALEAVAELDSIVPYFTPAANLTARVAPRVLFGDAGVDLWVLATDRHLDWFLLEYADLDAPSAWVAIGLASDEPLLGERWGTWLPPGNGRYRVRITAADRAGNVLSHSKRVAWNGDNDIANLYTEHRHISPRSSPGIKDSLVFHYTVLRPSNLDFAITDEDGNLIVEIPVAADEPGPATTTWDGNDAFANPVPDGDYLLTYGNASWPVTVDNTPPRLVLRFDDLKLVDEAPDAMRFLDENLLVGELFAAVREDYLQSWEYQVFGTTQEGAWTTELTRSGQLERDGSRAFKALGAHDLVKHDRRLVAVDLAGNEAITTARLRDERLLFTSSEPPCRSTPEPCRYPDRPDLDQTIDAGGFLDSEPQVLNADYDTLLIQSTVWADNDDLDLVLQYREASVGGLPAGEWQEGTIQVSTVPVRRRFLSQQVSTKTRKMAGVLSDHLLALYWDHPGLANLPYQVRLRATNDDGQEIVSESLLFYPEVPLTLEHLGTSHAGERYRVTNVSESVVRSVDLGVRQVRWTGEIIWWDRLRVVDRLDPGQQAEVDTGCLFLAEGNELIRAQGQGSLGEEAVSLPLLLPRHEGYSSLASSFHPARCSSGSSLGSGFLGVGDKYPCVDEWPPPWPLYWASTGVPYPVNGRVPPDPAGVEVQQYELLVDGLPYLSLNGPLADPQYQALIDLSRLPEGEHTVSERYVYGAEPGLLGQCPQSFDLTIDRTPPELTIVAPAYGSFVCPADLTMDVELAADDQTLVEHVILIDNVIRTVHPKGCQRFAMPGGSFEVAVNTLEPGVHELGVHLMDEAGNCTRSAIDIVVPDLPSIVIRSRPEVFSPVNTMGRPLVHETHFTTGTPGTYEVGIAGVAVNGQTGTVEGGDEDVIFAWDGRDAGGTLQPDGHYRSVITARSPCGAEQTRRSTPFELDATPPEVVLHEPQPDTLVGSSLEFRGLVRDAKLEAYRLQVVPRDGGTGDWLTVHVSQRQAQRVDAPLGTWDASSFRPGDYLVRVHANDEPGNEAASVEIPVTLRERRFIRRFARDPDLFSPNADGVLDQTELYYLLIQDALITLMVVDADQQIIATQADGQLDVAFADGTTVLWTGRTDAGGIAADGTYEVVLRAEDPAVPPMLDAEQERLSVTVDTVPPALAVISPVTESLNGLPLQITGSHDELHPDEWSLDLVLPDGSIRRLAEGGDIFTSRMLAELDQVPDGGYELIMNALDGAGNPKQVTTPFTIDNTAPAVQILSPAGGLIANTCNDYLELEGEVIEDHLAGYTWSYAPGSSPPVEDFVVIHNGGNTLADGTVTHSWDASGLADGTYTIRLSARDELARETEVRRTLVVDNTPPQLQLSQPAEGAVISGETEILGSVDDLNLRIWSLELAVQGGAPVPPPLAMGAQPENGTLATWAALPVDGAYELRLQAEDRAGNSAELSVGIEVQVTPPVPPELISAELTGPADVVLTWQSGDGPPAVGYNVFRDGGIVNPVPIVGTTFVDAGLAEGAYAYTVRALGGNGMESPDSNAIGVEINLTPPVVNISVPAPDSRVCDQVRVLGTAHRDSGFASWQLWVRRSPDGAWALLGGGTAPVVAGLLAVWDTAQPHVPDGLYELKLTADDRFGHLAVTSVVVEVDNTRPAAPLLRTAQGMALDADAVLNDIRVQWTLDPTPADLAGYYLYRNGLLANAPGPVVGSPAPFLINGTSWDDKDLADGTYVYSVTAADTAANESEPSNQSDPITIDTRRPHAVIVEPPDGSQFEQSVRVTAECPDLDVVSVELEYMREGGAWVPLTGPLSERPWVADFAPGAPGLYYLRAIAADAMGPDPAPQPISLTQADLPPAAPRDVALRVDGGSVYLSWAPVADPSGDLAGYRVYRGSDLITLTPLSPSVTAFEDGSLADGWYEYRITAVDTAGNEGEASPWLEAVVETAVLYHQPPVTRLGSLVLSGRVDSYDEVAELQRLGIGGSFEPVAEVEPADGDVTFPPQPLEHGFGTYRFVATDGNGNRSKASRQIVILRHDPPSAPEGLFASVAGSDVTLSWQPSGDPASEGFTVARLGSIVNETVQPLLYDPAGHSLTASNGVPAEWQSVVDGNTESGWLPGPAAAETGVVWQWTWPSPRLLHEATVVRGAGAAPAEYSFEVEVEGRWLWWDWRRDWDTSFTVDLGVRATGVRVTMPPGQYCATCSLDEVSLSTVTRTQSPPFVDSGLADGSYRYDVSERNSWGQVSGPATARVVVGGEALMPPTNLSAWPGVCGAVELGWMPPSTLPAEHLGYRLYRAVGAEAFIRVADLATNQTGYSDPGLAPGTLYRYHVTTLANVAGLSLESEPSGQAVARAECAVAPRPVILEPTIAGIPIDWPSGRADIGGRAFPGSMVTLLHDGEAVTSTLLAPIEPDRVIDLPGYRSYGPELRLAPSGDHATYLAAAGSAHIVVRNLVSGESLHFAGSEPANPAVDPAGEVVVYSGWAPDQYDLFLIDLATGSTTKLTDDKNDDAEPVFSADGSRVIYTSVSAATWEYQVKQVDLGSGAVSVLYSTPSTELWTPAISPDGRYVAVASEEGPKVIDTVTGEIDEVFTFVEMSMTTTPFSSDARLLIWAEYPDWSAEGAVLRIRDLVAKTTSTFSPAAGEFAGAFIDRSTVVFLHASSDGMAVRTRCVVDAAETTLAANLSRAALPDSTYALWDLSVTGDGSIWIPQEAQLHRLQRPSGSFLFPDVALHPGSNLIVARQGLDGAEQDSLPIEIDVAPELFPDAEAVAVTATPAYPITGDLVVVEGTVRNSGHTNLEQCVVALVLISPPAAPRRVLAEAIDLPAGASTQIRHQWSTAGLGGDLQWRLELDPTDSVPELDEYNNVATVTVGLRDRRGVEVTATTDRDSYFLGDAAFISVTLTSNDAPAVIQAATRVETADGELVQTVEERVFDAFGYSREQYVVNWPVVNVSHGGYRVRVVVTRDGDTVAEATAPVDVIARIASTAEGSADRPSYVRGSTANLLARVHNTGDATLRDLTVRLAVEPVLAAPPVALQERRLAALPAGAVKELRWAWDTGDADPGAYRWVVTILDNHLATLADSVPFAFVISGAGVQLAGSLAVQPVVLEPGAAMDILASLSNPGDTAEENIGVRVDLIDVARGVSLARLEERIDLGAGATGRLSWSYTPAMSELAPYLAVLSATRQQGGEVLEEQLAAASFLLADLTPPDLELLQPAAGPVCNQVRVAARATDRLTEVVRIFYRRDDIEQDLPLYLESAEDLVFASRWFFQPGQEGPHRISAFSEDAAGNLAGPVEVVIDAVLDADAPEILIDGPADGSCASGTVVVTYSAVDAHPDSVAATLNGEPYASGEALPGDGSYLLVVTATDQCGQESIASRSFLVDSLAPLVEVLGVVNGGVYQQQVEIRWNVTDANLATVTALLDTDPVTSPLSVGDLGQHQLVITATDCAGNSSEQTVSFEITDSVVDLTGTLTADPPQVEAPEPVLLSGVVRNNAGNDLSGVVVTIRVLEPATGSTVHTWQSTVDLGGGAEIAVVDTLSTTAVSPGTYQAALAASGVLEGEPFDLQLASATFEVRDQTPPQVTLIHPQPGVSCVPVEIRARVSDAGSGVAGVWAVIDEDPQLVVLEPQAGSDGQLDYVGWVAFDQESSHALRIIADDLYGNRAETTAVEVEVDLTPPVLHVGAPDDGLCTTGPVTATFTASDASPHSVTATLNGEPYVSGTPISSDGDHRLVVVASDSCGLESRFERHFIIDTSRPRIGIYGAASGLELAAPVEIRWRATDSNLAGSNAELDGQPVTSPVTVSELGQHRLWVRAYDCAGNEANKQVEFTVVEADETVVLEVEHGIFIRNGSALLLASQPDGEAIEAWLGGQGIHATRVEDACALGAALASGLFDVIVLDRPMGSPTIDTTGCDRESAPCNPWYDPCASLTWSLSSLVTRRGGMLVLGDGSSADDCLLDLAATHSQRLGDRLGQRRVTGTGAVLAPPGGLQLHDLRPFAVDGATPVLVAAGADGGAGEQTCAGITALELRLAAELPPGVERLVASVSDPYVVLDEESAAQADSAWVNDSGGLRVDLALRLAEDDVGLRLESLAGDALPQWLQLTATLTTETGETTSHEAWINPDCVCAAGSGDFVVAGCRRLEHDPADAVVATAARSGAGSTLELGWDLEAPANAGSWELLPDAYEYVLPDRPWLLSPGVPVPASVVVHNLSEVPVDLDVERVVPDGLLIEAWDDPVADDPVRWRRQLQPGGAISLVVWVMVPEAGGSRELPLTVSYQRDGSWIAALSDADELVTDWGSPAEELRRLVHDLGNMAAGTDDPGRAQVLLGLLELLNRLARLETGSGAVDADCGVELLLQAQQRIDGETDREFELIRWRLARLEGQWQRRWFDAEGR